MESSIDSRCPYGEGVITRSSIELGSVQIRCMSYLELFDRSILYFLGFVKKIG